LNKLCISWLDHLELQGVEIIWDPGVSLAEMTSGEPEWWSLPTLKHQIPVGDIGFTLTEGDI
jgi:hypothetical protein